MRHSQNKRRVWAFESSIRSICPYFLHFPRRLRKKLQADSDRSAPGRDSPMRGRSISNSGPSAVTMTAAVPMSASQGVVSRDASDSRHADPTGNFSHGELSEVGDRDVESESTTASASESCQCQAGRDSDSKATVTADSLTKARNMHLLETRPRPTSIRPTE
jgi:hypothetical protein